MKYAALWLEALLSSSCGRWVLEQTQLAVKSCLGLDSSRQQCFRQKSQLSLRPNLRGLRSLQNQSWPRILEEYLSNNETANREKAEMSIQAGVWHGACTGQFGPVFSRLFPENWGAYVP